jgi:glycine oxidase
MRKYDFVVVGGASLGMAIAYRLADRLNASIAVIDYQTGGAASRAAGAMLGCFGEVTKYTFAHQATREKFNLMYAAHQAWPKWMEELEQASGEKIWHTPGTHVILNSQGGVLDEENYEAVISALKKYDEPYEEINPRSIEALDAAAAARPLRAMYIGEGAVNSHQYLSVLKKACEKKNIDFIDGNVTKVKRTDDVYLFEGDFEQLQSQNTVLAAGSYTGDLIKNSGLGIDVMPILAGVGFAMVTETRGSAFKHAIRTANRSGSCGLHLVPFGKDREYIGATNVLYTSPQHEAFTGMVKFLSQCAVEQLKRSIFWSTIKEYRVGNRPVALDTLPLIGKTSFEGLFIATGTYRDGFHCSPVIADSIAAEVQDKKPLVSSTFRPERKPIQTQTQEESIREYALQSLSGSYELWLSLPGTMDDSDLIQMFEAKARKIYAALETRFALNTDILFCLSMPLLPENGISSLRDYLQTVQSIPSKATV